MHVPTRLTAASSESRRGYQPPPLLSFAFFSSTTHCLNSIKTKTIPKTLLASIESHCSHPTTQLPNYLQFGHKKHQHLLFIAPHFSKSKSHSPSIELHTNTPRWQKRHQKTLLPATSSIRQPADLPLISKSNYSTPHQAVSSKGPLMVTAELQTGVLEMAMRL